MGLTPTQRKAAPAGPAPLPARPKNIPPGFSIDSAAPPVAGASDVTIWLDEFVLPKPKGAGEWVQRAYDEATAGKRLGTILHLSGSSYAAWKEDSKTDEYRSQWLHRHGFTSFANLAQTLTAASTRKAKPVAMPKQVKQLLPKLGGGLSSIGCDIDHIVEKQMGGTSEPSNLQLLTSTINQASGREAYLKLKEHAQTFLDYSPDWSKVRRISMRIARARVEATPDDASTQLEKFLRDTPGLGNATVTASEDRSPLFLEAAGAGETLQVKAKGNTAVDEAGVRIVPGVRLDSYQRKQGKQGPDIISGELDHRAIQKSKSGKKKNVDFEAHPFKAAPAPVAAPDAAAGAPTPLVAPAGVEHRTLKLNKANFPKLAFYYPYLSEGVINTVDLDAQGALTGTGTITPTISFLPVLDIAFGPNELKLQKKLDVAMLNGSPLVRAMKGSFRFTESSFDLDLLNFVPSGRMIFTIGPADKPLVTGTVTAAVEGGELAATGTLVPGAIPGIRTAEGQVTYSRSKGWSGFVRASSTTLPGASQVDVMVGVREGAGGLTPYAEGGITAKVRDGILTLRASLANGAIRYAGGVDMPRPFPIVDAVRLDGTYERDLLKLSGTVKGFKWRDRFQGDLIVHYHRKDGEDARLSGTLSAKTIGDPGKMDGDITLALHENGRITGRGSIAYQITKDIRPRFGVELTADEQPRLKLTGELTIASIPLAKEWPKPGGERREILRGVGVKVSFPTPVVGLTVYFSAHGSFGIKYGIGPLAITNVVFKGVLFPLEDDPKIDASLVGRLSAPGFAGVYGTFGARLGAELAGGAVGLNGGIDVTPSLTLAIDAGVAVNATYKPDTGFEFHTDATVDTKLIAQLAFELKASIYGAYGALEHSWTHPLNDPKPREIGPNFKVTLGRIGYSRERGIEWPSLDQIDYTPKDFDPKSLIIDLLAETEPQKV